MKRIIVLSFFILLLMAPLAFSQPLLRKQVIACAPGDSTTFFYTNKTTAFYYGETCRLNSTAFQGLNVFSLIKRICGLIQERADFQADDIKRLSRFETA